MSTSTGRFYTGEVHRNRSHNGDDGDYHHFYEVNHHFKHLWTYGLFSMAMLNNQRVYPNLIGALEHDWIMTFHSVGNVIIPTDETIFFRGVGIPPTSYGD